MKPAKLLTEIEAADLLRVSIHTLRYLRRNGRGPAYTRVGRQIRYSEPALIVYLRQHAHS